MTLPKVLVVGQPFHRNSGGGITLTNLFEGWDPDRLAVVCVGNLLEGEIYTSICRNYYRLGTEEHHWVFPFSLFKRKYASGPVSMESAGATQEITVNKSSLRVKFIMDYFFPFLEYLGIFHLLSKITLSEPLKRWLDEVNPDVIYAQAPTREMVLFCLAVHSYLNKPMVYHLMDDWPATIGNKGLLSRYWRRRVDQDLQELLDRSDYFMSISDLMGAEYLRRFNKPSTAFHNPLHLDFWGQHQRTRYELSDAPVMLYAGRVGLGIDSSLEAMARAIEQVNRELSLSIRLLLHTDKKPAWADRYPCVERRPLLPYQAMPRLFAEADFLVLPYDFSGNALKFIKYSMPTKASEFMISGTPILLFAPEGTAIVDYARGFGWAEVVTENSVDKLAERIKYLVTTPEARRELAQRAVQTAEDRHDAAKVNAAFRDIIQSLAAERSLV